MTRPPPHRSSRTPVTRSAECAIASHYLDLWRYARSLSRDQGDAEELVQDCLVRALSQSKRWNHVRNPRAYLLTILHNTYVDGIAGRVRANARVALDDLYPQPSHEAPQLAALEIRDLARAFATLPSEQRATLAYVGIDGMSYQEVAARMGIALGTVMSRVSRARSALRQAMEGGGSARDGDSDAA